ncbi:ATP-binding protein [Metabacillus litoralis]|uniref:ATP-binding protein n=1 Tax=Metabacillus TaxID=2675233 RepID=UPI001BA430B9|nr:ATP-binding protein [Metabacillus litoralis]MCM3161288.1 ATP-binding protein [Metabacillus litoralis]MCM3412161.1 ATP-binding protein [Metabacillus litoralis]UHA61837.1 ATP-binding protein [Metabacillus litoralis]
MKKSFVFTDHDQFQQSLPDIEAFIEKCARAKKTVIIFSIMEAVNNALEHGTKENQAIPITLNLEVKEKCFSVECDHKGEGFDYKEKLEHIGNPDQYFENNIRSIRGRGIAIMKKCSDMISYSDNGRKVFLAYHLDKG